MLTIHNLLSPGKWYNLGITKKCNGHKVCTKSIFDYFLLHHLKNLKYLPLPTYLA
ncbi:hypothetical protein MUK42_18735 [Musa troglodytarum]|uniref:Uncharacterized protein n=1 Tax=Musa troglodytarum TaxID=320322 RepID=A0A9E7FUA4_9LILI|nr:hypothetical protein MUK42_18735 [Musa troglodytarum]